MFAGIVSVRSTLVEMYYVSSLAWDGFGEHVLRYFSCPRRDWMGLVNTCSDAFLYSQAWDDHVLGCI